MLSKKDKKILADLEKGYDMVADKFSSTRFFMWRDLEFFKDMVKPGDKVLDFGCGNGRLTGFLENRFEEYVGLDISQRLVEIAKQKYNSEKVSFVKLSANFSTLPFKDNYFDIIFSIAVFHHFPSKGYALRVAGELQRVLKPSGKIVITVWNLWQKQYLEYYRKSKSKPSLEKSPRFGSRSNGWLEAEIPFEASDKIFQRYHHPFKLKELETLLGEAGFKKVKTKKGWNLIYIGKNRDLTLTEKRE